MEEKTFQKRIDQDGNMEYEVITSETTKVNVVDLDSQISMIEKQLADAQEQRQLILNAKLV